MIRIGVLFGGRSGEHDVSLCTAASVVSALDRSKYEITAIGIDRDGRWYVQDSPETTEHRDFGRVMRFEKRGNWFVNHFEQNSKLVCRDFDTGKEVTLDIIFPAVHGTYCEDGTLQGLLELAMAPFVGADMFGSAIGMDKDVSKRLLRDSGIPVVDWITVLRNEWNLHPQRILDEATNKFKYPVFVKPARTGSSVGVRKVMRTEELAEAIDFSFKYDNKILIEEGINAREIECAVIGNDLPEASCLGEVVPKHEFYSYEAKYIDPNGASLVIPADIEEDMSEAIRTTATMAFSALNCCGMARIDFFLDKRSGGFYLNEINTIPGFTSISMYPKLWAESGIGYSELLDRLIELGFEKHRERACIETAMQPNSN